MTRVTLNPAQCHFYLFCAEPVTATRTGARGDVRHLRKVGYVTFADGVKRPIRATRCMDSKLEVLRGTEKGCL